MGTGTGPGDKVEKKASGAAPEWGAFERRAHQGPAYATRVTAHTSPRDGRGRGGAQTGLLRNERTNSPRTYDN